MNNFRKRERWFIDRIKKQIFETESPCKCNECKIVYQNGLIIEDEVHAIILYGFQDSADERYFDTIEERDKYEKDLIVKK